jgi:lysophospholipase L1-like esterase
MAKHRRPRPALAAALRGGGIVVAVAVCLMAGAKLMSFAAGRPGAAAVGKSHANLDPATDGRRADPARAARQPGASPSGTATPTTSPTPLADVSGQTVTAVGDSVMVAATPALDQALPGIYIDALVGRQFSTGLQVIAQLKAEGQLRSIVVVGLGTNGTVTSDEISQLFAEIGPNRRLVLVNTFEDRSWEQEVNSTLAAAANAHPASVALADWYDTVDHRTDLLWPDGIHPQPAGGVVYAKMLKAAVDEVASLAG